MKGEVQQQIDYMEKLGKMTINIGHESLTIEDYQQLASASKFNKSKMVIIIKLPT